MIHILCYGDSNTWGYDPETDSRFPASVRWPGVLATLLGSKAVVIEEGLTGRTTNASYPDRPGRNGAEYLAPCLDSHFPLDAVVLMLGTNDAKAAFHRFPQDIARGLETLVEMILGQGLEDPSPNVRIVLVAPPPVKENAQNLERMRGAANKIEALAPLYQSLAERRGLGFVNLSDLAPGAHDGIHLTAQGHATVAQRVLLALREVLPTRKA